MQNAYYYDGTLYLTREAAEAARSAEIAKNATWREKLLALAKEVEALKHPAAQAIKKVYDGTNAANAEIAEVPIGYTPEPDKNLQHCQVPLKNIKLLK